MKKILLITIIMFLSCSKDTVFPEPAETNLDCDCTEKLYQVSSIGTHILINTINVSILCSLNGDVFDKTYNGNRLIKYKIYNCN